MAGIIKSAGPLRAADGATFNFDDMAVRAGQYLEQVRKQAAQILAQAGKDAAALRAKAEQEGRAAAQKAVEQMVDQRVAQQMTTLLPALKQAVTGIQEAKQSWLRHWERQGVHAAAAIAARVIRREVRQAPEITLTLLREALELAAGSHDIQVQLNPTDHASLGRQAEQLIQELGRIAGARVVASPSVTPGGCRVETRFGTIDQTFEAQLARIEQELT
jgi:flagellar assembly protein FliH